MRLSETNLKKDVIDFLRKEYPQAWFYKSADRFTSGIPDLILCINGMFYAIELKVGRNDPTKIQEYVLNKIQSAGGRAVVCRSVDEVKEFLKEGGAQDDQDRRQGSNSSKDHTNHRGRRWCLLHH